MLVAADLQLVLTSLKSVPAKMICQYWPQEESRILQLPFGRLAVAGRGNSLEPRHVDQRPRGHALQPPKEDSDLSSKDVLTCKLLILL